jgi:LmbE family N-acetylglucosaminyl deacetylase
MKNFLITLLLSFIWVMSSAQNDPLRIIAIGAHPDDCDYKFGGTAALLAAKGHQVKFLALTSGDAGHQSQGGGALAKRRRSEAKEAGKRLGIAEYETLDNHDAELFPSLQVRHQVIRKIREWKADVVLGLRPYDYHPDHRNAGKVVQDAAYMVIVPNVTPDTPPLEKNPVFLYMHDRFERPYPHVPDIAIAIDEVMDKKIDALDAHESQMYEWGPWTDNRSHHNVPKDETKRKLWLTEQIQNYSSSISDSVRKSLEKWYGAKKAANVKYVESFEVAEYGHQPSDQEIRTIFPMLMDAED